MNCAQPRIISANAKKFGVAELAAIIDGYAACRRKWAALSKEIGRDIDRFAAAIQRQICDKVDPEKMQGRFAPPCGVVCPDARRQTCRSPRARRHA